MMILGPSCLLMAKIWIRRSVKTIKSMAITPRPNSYDQGHILGNKTLHRIIGLMSCKALWCTYSHILWAYTTDKLGKKGGKNIDCLLSISRQIYEVQPAVPSGPRVALVPSGSVVGIHPLVSEKSPAAQSQNEESDGCEITLVPHILDVVPHPLEYEGTAHKEGLSTRVRGVKILYVDGWSYLFSAYCVSLCQREKCVV